MTRSWLRLLGGPAAVLIVALSAEAKAGPLQDCAAMLPWCAQVMAAQGAPHTDLCRLAYVLRHNDHRRVPDWVAWPTGRTHAAGCIPRRDSFRTDPGLAPGIGGPPAGYHESTHDCGPSSR